MNTPDPLPIGESIPSALKARLAAKGLDLKTAAELDMARTETPTERARRAEDARAHAQARWATRLPVMYAGATLADLEDLDGAMGVTGWLTTRTIRGTGGMEAHLSPTLVLAGSVGTGKTHAAYAIGNTAVAAGTWVEAWTCHDLLEVMRPNGNPAAAMHATRCDLLILDDLGAGNATEWAKDELTSLVDARLREGRRQIVTTNHPYDVLVETWGQRLMDRLRFRWTVATMAGESRRQAAW